MVTTVTNNSVQQINTSLFSLEKMINELDKKTSNHTGKGLTKINNINLNNLTQNGIYYSLGKDNLVNKPDDSMYNNIIEVVSQGNELIVQTFTYLVENEIYVRNKLNNGSWTDWVIVSNNPTNVVTSVNGKQGDVTLDASDVGALPDTTVIPAAQVNSDWNATSGVAEILNKPTIPTKTSQLTNDSDFATNATVLSDIASALSGGQTYGINITGNASTAQKLSIALSFESGVSTVYKKISGLVVPNQENVFLLQSRAGELLLMSIGHGDGMQLATPKVKRLLDVYSKIQGFSILNSDVIVKIADWSHECYLTQIAGSTILEITISNSTQSEYDSGTPITIET